MSFPLRLSIRPISGRACRRNGHRTVRFTVPAGADHGRRLQHHGHVGAARCAFRFRCLALPPGRMAGAGDPSSVPQIRERSRSRSISHGRSGAAIQIRRAPHSEWPPFAGAMERAAIARGLARSSSINEDAGAGFFPMPVSQSDSGRASSASAYLTREVRRRPNLRIMADTLVTRSGSMAVRPSERPCAAPAKQQNIDAHEVIVSAGAIHSPAMLMRAGIGPEARSAALASLRSPSVPASDATAESSVSQYGADSAAACANG